MSMTRPVLFVAFVLSSTALAFGSPANTYTGLKFGSYGVGVSTQLVRDYSRGWMTLSGPIPYRPILMRIWYPSSSKTTRMPFGDYLKPLNDRGAVAAAVQSQIDYSTSSLKNAVGNDAAAAQRLFQTVVPAKIGAPPASGSFPIIIYGIGQNDHIAENTVLSEFLASHGYIVATAAQFGTNERRGALF